MGTPPYRRASGEPAKTGPVFRRAWLPVLMLVGTLAVVGLISGGEFSAVLQTWAFVAFVLPVLLAAGMLGLALLEFAERSWRRPAPLPDSAAVAADPGAPGHLQIPGWADGWHALLALGLGMGALSLAMLVLGSLHLLDYGIPVSLLVVSVAVGFFPTRRFLQRWDRACWREPLDRHDLLLLLACIPLAILLIAVTFPPGRLWISEGRGYDVLEYHLQLPREYAAANSTAPLAHNVYSFLPANMEMLYLLLVALTRLAMRTESALFAVYPAQMLHACLMFLAAGAVALLPLTLSKVGRVLAFVTVLSVPWTLVTGSLAYNEAAMLLFAALALGLVLGPRGRGPTWLAGILLGLAVGCKMTAGVMLALPIGLLLLAQRRWAAAAAVTLLALLTYAPWAVRSLVYTHRAESFGNPVFPIAAETLGRGHWTPEQVTKWNRGHAPQGPQATPAGRLQALTHESLLDPQWSPGWATLQRWMHSVESPLPEPSAAWPARVGLLWLIVPLAVVLALSRGEGAWQLLLMAIVQLGAWLLWTHLQGRFLLPLVIPLALLVGLGAEALRGARVIIGTVVGLQACLCAFLLLPEAGLFAGPHGPQSREALAQGEPPTAIGTLISHPYYFRLPDLFLSLRGPVRLPEDTRTALVGTAAALYYHGPVLYHTVWDRNVLAEKLRTGRPAAVREWLLDEGVEFLVVDWNEVERLRNTYGYAPEITPQAMAELQAVGLVPLENIPGSDGRPILTVYQFKPKL